MKLHSTDESVVEYAETIIEDEIEWSLSPEQSRAIITSFLIDSEPNEALQRAYERYKASGIGETL